MDGWTTTFDARDYPPKQVGSSAWQMPVQVQELPRPDFADNEELKQAYGIALGRGLAPFEAGLEVFANDTPKALWASTNWLKDPVTNAAKDAYVAALKKHRKPLDKEELLQEILDHARIAPEFKDRASLFKLYSDVAGYTGKAEPIIDNSTKITKNEMKVILVRPEPRALEQNAPNLNTQSKIQNDELPLPKLKLVGGNSR